MGALGSTLGGIFTILGLFMAGWATWVFTDNYLLFLLFPLFGILGGMALGALNSRKARTQEKYKNEYVAYASMMFAAVVMLAVYFFIWGKEGVTDAIASGVDLTVESVIGIALGSAIVTQIGLGLVIANSMAESSGF